MELDRSSNVRDDQQAATMAEAFDREDGNESERILRWRDGLDQNRWNPENGSCHNSFVNTLRVATLIVGSSVPATGDLRLEGSGNGLVSNRIGGINAKVACLMKICAGRSVFSLQSFFQIRIKPTKARHSLSLGLYYRGSYSI